MTAIADAKLQELWDEITAYTPGSREAFCAALNERLGAAEKQAKFLEDSEHYGHKRWCGAVRGPGDENWYEHERCDCGRNTVLAAYRQSKERAP